MKFDCYILTGYRTAEIEADSAEDAKAQFVQLIRDNLGTEHVEADLVEADEVEEE